MSNEDPDHPDEAAPQDAAETSAETPPTDSEPASEAQADEAQATPDAQPDEAKATPDAQPDQADEAVGGFAGFGFDERLLSQLEEMGFDQPTPIQAEAMPHILAGRDIIGRARTGSGKTAAFALPLLELVKEGGRKPRALVLSPTRELAKQIGEAIAQHGRKLKPVRGVTIYGGAPYPPQIKALRNGCSVVVGTPGRVIDLLNGGSLDLSELELFVLDEADEMLRMGFIDDVNKLLAETPEGRQVALFSATMPDQIRRVAARYLNSPVEVQVESKALSAEHIKQRFLVVPSRNKLEALQRVLRGEDRGTTLVFARTRASCMDVAETLSRGGYPAEALHGDLSQPARERVLKRLRSGELKLLVATDVAARGLDVGHITHVINLDLPESKELYVHRIGRTGRAGREGMAISLATPSQQRFMSEIQRSLGVKIERMDVPSDAQIIDRRRGALADRLGSDLDKLEYAGLWLEELQEQRGWTVEETATRALRLLAQKAGVSLSPMGDLRDEPPEWSRSKTRSPRGGHDSFRPGQGGPRSRGGDRPRHGSGDRPRHGSGDRPHQGGGGQPHQGGGGQPGQSGPPRDGRRGGPPEGEMVQLYIAVGRRHGASASDLVGALAGETGIPGAAIGKIHIADGASFVDLPADMARHIASRFDKIEICGVAASVDLSKTSPPGEGRSQRPSFGQGPGGGGKGPGFPYQRKFGGGPANRRDFAKGLRPGKVRSKK